MKAPVMILGASLLVNAGLVAALSRQPPAPAPTASGPSPSAVAGPSGDRRGAAAANLWSELDRSDVRELAKRMQAAGFPPNVIRAVAQAQLRAKYRPRLAALAAQYTDQPYWKPLSVGPDGMMKLFQEYSQVYRDLSKELRGLLGDELFTGGRDVAAAQARQFGALAPAKVQLLERINEDYSEMAQQVRQAADGILLPEDRDKLALLEREKRADIVAALTPEELAAFDMRNSPVTSRLRPAMTLMDASEAEFRTVYQVLAKYQDQLYPTGQGPRVMTAELAEQRQQIEDTAFGEVRAALGDQRFADFARASSSEYQQLSRLAQRDSVSTDAVNQAYALRETLAAQSAQIAANNDLTPAQRHEALKNLGTTARQQLTTMLGPTTADAYASSARWLTILANGNGFTVSAQGAVRPVSVNRAAKGRN